MTASSRTRVRTSAALASVLALAGLVVGLQPQSAEAAGPYATEGTITSITSNVDRVQTGETIELSGTWTLPDNPVTPAGLIVDLPEELTALANRTFPLLSPEGNAMGTCVQDGAGMECDLDAEYLRTHPLDIHGTFEISVQVHTEVDAERVVTYVVGDASFDLTVWTPTGSEQCTENCQFDGESPSKGGEVYDDGTIVWTVKLPTPPEGQSAGFVRVTDQLGANMVITDVQVIATDHLTLHPRYQTYELMDMQPLDPSEYTVSDDMTTVEFETREGWYYRVLYTTMVTDDLASTEYRNAATIEMTGQDAIQVEGNALTYAGEGTGVGTPGGEDIEPTPTPTPSEPGTPSEPTTSEPAPSEPTGTPSTAAPGDASATGTLPETGGEAQTALALTAAIAMLLGAALLARRASRRGAQQG